jgi:tetratricopeptide (TPR) repeat protein
MILTTGSAVGAQDSRLARLDGRIIADGRPVSWVVEVRFDSETGGTVGTAYTLSGEDFEFRNVPINSSDVYYIVVEEPGFLPYRERIYFNRDPFNSGVRHAGGTKMIFLDRVPGEGEPAPEEQQDTVDLRQLLTEIPDDAREAYDEAVEQIDEGNREAARESLERAVALAPEYYEALSALGAEYLRNRRYDEAEDVLQRAAELNRSDPIPLTNLGTMHFQIGQTLEASGTGGEDMQREVETAYANAVDLLDRAFRLDPASPRIAHYLGSALYKTGDYDRAESLLLEAIGRNPSLVEARVTLLNVYLRQDRIRPAIAQVDAILGADPDSARRAEMEGLRESLEDMLDASPAEGPLESDR